jgi:hypothetical protein
MQPAMKQSVRSRIPASLQKKLGKTPNRCGDPRAVLHPFKNMKETVQKKNPRPLQAGAKANNHGPTGGASG